MKIISIINLKGGVGKSVTACNLAYDLTLLDAKRRVLVVDLDKQGDSTDFFNVCTDEIPTMADVMILEKQMQDVIVHTKFPRIDFAPCSMEMIDANLTVLMDRLRPQQFRLKKALAKVAANYDICVIDCPPDLDTATINAMCATDFILIPADCARWATKGLKEVTRQIYEIKENINPNLEILGIVATKYTRSKPSMAALATLAEQDIPMLDSVIRFGSKINEANDRQIPVSMCAPDSNPAVDYMALTEEVLQRMKALA